MRVAGFVIAVFPLLLGVGCSLPPVTVRIDVEGPPRAAATIREISDVTDPSPIHCTTPCRVDFEEDAVFDIELKADGYYPARLTTEHLSFFRYKRVHDVDETPLVVPMVRRSTSAAALPGENDHAR